MDYREAGVDISAADAAKARIKGLAKSTFNASVLTEIGSFGGMFRPDLSRYREPVLVASTDGVGTKIKVAILAGRPRHRGLRPRGPLRRRHPRAGGGSPLLPRLRGPREDGPRQGRADRLRLLPRLRRVRPAPSSAGRPRRCRAPTPRTTTTSPGSSSGWSRRRRRCRAACARATSSSGCPRRGLHTNGYSLARKVLLETLGHRVDTHLPELGTTVGQALLAPHRSYLAALEPLLERDKVRALAHITGGGFPGNIPRVLPEGLGARLRRGSWEVPPLFRLIQKGGGVSDEEMERTFNMGDRHDRGRLAVRPPRGRALARAARGDELRDRQRRGRLRRLLGVRRR